MNNSPSLKRKLDAKSNEVKQRVSKRKQAFTRINTVTDIEPTGNVDIDHHNNDKNEIYYNKNICDSDYVDQAVPCSSVFGDLIRKFKSSVQSGSYYVCSCCYQTWFRQSVTKAELIKKTIFLRHT